ncbi:replicative DNA helicase [Allopseudospirillum japonicum]|uniref:Replicative DNA helicase n=1 Tax=Allopseudospirillum japonicum TaxID=64971 RepID=A0A1H6RNJ5_9GAMM|nr:replicative DNA helicase [Allopseudospirillum japonicum]SEI57321.1 replicative DNA helicase [Allopseudospirillum japonicum]
MHAQHSLMPTAAHPSKTPLYSMESEQSVLGALLIDEEVWEQVQEKISSHEFYRLEHRQIYQAIADLISAQKAVDLITVFDYLKNKQQDEQIGGMNYLSALIENTPSVRNISAYADIIHEYYLVRSLLKAANEIADQAANYNNASAETLLNEAERRIFALNEQKSQQNKALGMSELLASTINRLDELYRLKGGLTGLGTGFDELDRMTSGLQAGELAIIAGRPSMGKTTFAMNLVENALLHTSAPVVVFSLEMPAEQLMMRMFSSLGRIDQTRVRTGQLEDNDWPKITSVMNMLQGKPLFVDASAGLSPNDLFTRTRRIAREQGQNPALIMVDYLQLMQVPGAESRTAEISEISRALKSLAKEFKCPVVALSQLSRKVEERVNKRPMMSDLRESGAIEQDADLIAFVYRDEVYNKDNPENKGLAEIIIGKQRNGPTGTVHLVFCGQFTRFDNLADESLQDYAQAYQ